MNEWSDTAKLLAAQGGASAYGFGAVLLGTSLEQPMLAAGRRARAQVHGFGVYNAMAAAAGSLGALTVAIPGILGGDNESRWFLLLVPVALAGVLIARALSGAVEPTRLSGSPGRLDRSRPVVVRLSSLFALDSFGGGFTVSAFIAYWLRARFDAHRWQPPSNRSPSASASSSPAASRPSMTSRCGDGSVASRYRRASSRSRHDCLSSHRRRPRRPPGPLPRLDRRRSRRSRSPRHLAELVCEPATAEGDTLVITIWPDHATFDAWIATPERDALTASDVHQAVDCHPITHYDVAGGYLNLVALARREEQP